MKKGKALFITAVSAAIICSMLYCAEHAERQKARTEAAYRAADFILDLQQPDGAIIDGIGADTVNEDSNMEYALMALCAAYQRSGQKKYLDGLEKGICWLGRTEITDHGKWRGSWWYLYDKNGNHVQASVGNGVYDIRGVDTTSALFVYLLYLDWKCGGSDKLTEKYRGNAEAALDFLLRKSMTKDGFTAGSFQMDRAGNWNRYDCCYSADQGDVWLGFHAGEYIFGSDEYRREEVFLRKAVPAAFFSARYGRYCTAIEDGRQDWNDNGFDPVQSQGWLPWMWGNTVENRAAVGWLKDRIERENTQEYFISAAILGLGENGIGGRNPDGIETWILKDGTDDRTGGIFDSSQDHIETVNVAAFCVMALLGWKVI